jgi:hypothetical protein
MEQLPLGMRDKIAEEALRRAMRELCRGGSWEGVVRGVAWQVASTDARDPRSIEMLAEAAEAIYASLIDEALWAIEQVVVQAWDEFLELRPGDEEGALAAARLDACEESIQIAESIGERVLETLLAGVRHAA